MERLDALLYNNTEQLHSIAVQPFGFTALHTTNIPPCAALSLANATSSIAIFSRALGHLLQRLEALWSRMCLHCSFRPEITTAY